MVGVDPASDGLERARRPGVEASARRRGLAAEPRELPDLVFEATSARAHLANAPRYAEAGIQAVDLTPAAVGPMVCPPVNLGEHLAAPNVNMITCGGQATIPAGPRGVGRSPRCRMRRSWRRSRRAPPGRAPGPTSTSSPRPRRGPSSRIGGAERGKAVIILNPVDPPMIMRDTVFCAISPDADHDAITDSVLAMVGRGGPVRAGLHAARRAAVRPARARTGAAWPGSRLFLEVRGNGDYLPPWAGNLDIMTAAAAQVGDLLARARRCRHDRGGDGMTRDLRITDSTLRDGSHAMAHQFTEGQVRQVVAALDAAGVEVIEVSHGDGLGGSSFNYGFSAVDEIRLVRAAADEAPAARIAVLLLPGVGHGGGPEGRPRGRGVGGADRDPLHRGGRVGPALRGRARPGHGDRRFPHARPPARSRRAGRAGPDHGRRRRAVRVRGRLRGGAGAGRRAGAGRGALSRETRRRRAGRLPRPPEPVPGGGQLRARLPGRARPRSTARCARSAPGPATRRPRCWPPPSTGWASAPGSTCRACWPPPRTSSGRSSPGCRGWTAPRSSRATPGSTPRSCCTPSAPRSATAYPRTRSCSGSVRPATSAARKT